MVGGEKVLVVRLEGLEAGASAEARPGDRTMEFHVSRKARDELGLETSLFRSTGNVIIPDFGAARTLAARINERVDATLLPEKTVRAGRLNAMALIDEILHDVARLYREGPAPKACAEVLADMDKAIGARGLDGLLLAFVEDFPPLAVYRGEIKAQAWLSASQGSVPNRHLALEEFFLLRLANENPAFAPYRYLFDDGSRASDSIASDARGPSVARGAGPAPEKGTLAANPSYGPSIAALDAAFSRLPKFGPDNEDLATMLRAPMRAAPYSLPGQLDYIRRHWGLILGERFLRLLGALDLIREEEKPHFPGPGPTRAYVYRGMEAESERFSPDKDWMPNVVMMAKSTLVWLYQLSRAYGRAIKSLDAIPDEELDSLALRGFNGLWLIGLWERSQASAEIKRRCGNPEAAASAYSLFDYEIANELGGWPALENLRERCSFRGIRLAADMVPNHTGIDSSWVRERPELFMRRGDCPFPGYSFNGPDLSGDGQVGIWLEDHYWDRTDAAVVFKRLDRASGRVDYIYHGNDGTGLPWSDTAQIDFLNKAAREAVKERILHVAKNFPIIRFDAAMVLAKKHFRRLWYPEPGSGGDVPSRAGLALDSGAFDAAMPEEFWREVVDMCAKDAPDTLLLAEAFWMMEGYFVRTLGMHRVYNSAFMNMLKREENQKYRETIKNTQEFDKDILKRFVNFMNNPDEETAVTQFGKGDKYFGVCTMMATMPGLPMFGHGQVDGLEEKYGMEYRRAYRDETADPDLIARHEREIFPLLKRRRLFSGVDEFLLYDLVGADGSVNENAFVYTNGAGGERALVVYNNAYAKAQGRIRESCAFAEKGEGGKKRITRRSLAQAFGLRCEDGRFLVMREDRSRLWYLRRSREICESGLALLLEGYQSQVFLDIFEIQDDERGLYGAVCESLDGRGVPDLSEALEDVALKDLYSSLSGLARRELFSGARRAVEEGLSPATRRKEAKALSALLSGSALDFYSGVVGLIDKEATEESPLGAGRAEEARDRFVADLQELAEIAALAEPSSHKKATTANGKGDAGQGDVSHGEAGQADAAFVLGFLRAPAAAEIAAAYCILDGLKALALRADRGEAARRIAERIFLERKLREALRTEGMAGDAAHRGLALAAIYLGRSEGFAAFRPGDGAAAGALAFLAAVGDDDELKSKLGVNRFEGVEWFNKEHFEEAISLGIIVAALSDSAPGSASKRRELAARLEAAHATASVFREAEAASGYRVEDFREALASYASRNAGDAKGRGGLGDPGRAGAAKKTHEKGKKA